MTVTCVRCLETFRDNDICSDAQCPFKAGTRLPQPIPPRVVSVVVEYVRTRNLSLLDQLDDNDRRHASVYLHRMLSLLHLLPGQQEAPPPCD